MRSAQMVVALTTPSDVSVELLHEGLLVIAGITRAFCDAEPDRFHIGGYALRSGR